MPIYYYLSMTPESLVASMLPPEEFGTYLAIGTRQMAHGQAMYFDLDFDGEVGDFALSYAKEHCTPHANGHMKHSLYLAIYRVLERIPLNKLKSLWLATEKGKVLELQQRALPAEFPGKYYLYQELCPVHPLVASRCSPDQFSRFITDPQKPFFVPRICFVDLDLGELGLDPEHAKPKDLYYPERFAHLRECLLELDRSPEKHSKTVDRLRPACLPYHCINRGFFVGCQENVVHYPFPSRADLEGKYYHWWRRSAHA